MKDCDDDKAPSPDSFNMTFFQNFWHEIKSDVLKFFNDFHRHGSFVKPLNSTFIVLIAKKDGADCSLISSVYKLLSKVLAKRFSKSLKCIIGNSQHAFIDGRQITDAIMIANEVVDDLSRTKNSELLCKLDMEKAFDNVS